MAVVDMREFRRQQRKMFSKGADAGVVSPPLLGLPLKRVIPQDIHSMLDYQGALTTAISGAMSGGAAATVGTILGVAGLGVSLLTDYRLSVKKVIPIEVHEAIDYIWSAATIAAPFVFGYFKKAPLAAAAHIMVGVSTILGSLVTDYRAAKGIHWSNSPTLPAPIGA